MSDFKPALTAEEWELWIDKGLGGRMLKNRHGQAAVCLYEQPYGFTREEIAFLRRADGLMVSHHRQSISPTIEKILALLPPETQ